MEKRAIIAAMLMAGLLMVYQFLFVQPEPRQPPPGAQKSEQVAPPGRTEPPAEAKSAPVPPPPVEEGPRPAERKAIVETPLYRAVISSLGGAIERWELHYRGDKPMLRPGVLGSQGLVVLRPGQGAVQIAFTVDRDSLKLAKGDGQGELRL